MNGPITPRHPDGPGNAGQHSPQRHGPAAGPPYGGQPPPSPYGHVQHQASSAAPHATYPQQPPGPAPKPKNKTLLWALAGGGLAAVLVVAAAALFLGNGGRRDTAGEQFPSSSAAGHGGGPGQSPTGTGSSNLLGKSPQELLPLLPAPSDFPAGTQVQPYIDTPGEANADERVAPLPPEATNPPDCWNYLQIRKNRDDLPDITRIVTAQAKGDKGQTVAAAQIAKENNNVDVLQGAKAWLGRCQEFDYLYQIRPDQPPVHFRVAPLPGPAGFSDPFYGVEFTEIGPQGPRGHEYFFAARIRGLLVLSEGVCDLSTCDESQNAQMRQQIPIMFSKVVQGLRNMQ
jgi:hypothetical protein